jgi:tetratricopeptide (TPR) repeat protein
MTNLPRADFEAALEHADDAAVRAAACVGIGNLQRQLGKRGLAERAYRAALEHHVEAADVAGQAKLLASLGGMLHERGRVAQARALHERALALHRELSDERGAAVVLQNLGLIMQEQGQLDAAEAAFQQAHRLHVELGNRRFTAIATFDLACLCCERGLWSDAASRAQAALEDLRAVGDRRQSALALATRGICAAALGRLEDAHVDLDEARAQLATIDDLVFGQVVEVHRGHLELGLSRRAYAQGEDRSSAALLASARARLSPMPAPRSSKAARRSVECDELRLASRVLRASVTRHAKLSRSLLVASDQAWLRAPLGRRGEVSSRRVLRRLLSALVERRLSAPTTPLSPQDLIRCGWPDERVATPAARNRLQVALAELRKLGLAEVLLLRGDGYLIDPRVELMLVDVSSAPEPRP